jgi:ketosteroid isomerase-like protein
MGDIGANKAAVRARYETTQRNAIPNPLAVPGEAQPDPRTGQVIYSCQDPPGGIDDPAATIGAIAGWHQQSIGPSFISYGPMIGEGDDVVEEWESYFHGADGTLYNNHYCWIVHVDDGKVVQTREYVDSHHAYTILGLHATWLDVDPPTAPRQRWRPLGGDVTIDERGLDRVFEISRQFELDPKLLRDVSPAGWRVPGTASTPSSNKAVIGALHDAQANGDQPAIDALHAEGFRHFIAGEGPFGWDHLPVQEIYAPLVEHVASPILVRFGPMVAEGDVVFEEMELVATLDDGSVYDNWHCFIHELRDGLIVQTREYLDTHHAWVVLARWAAWGAEPVPPLRQARRSNLPVATQTFQGRNPFLDIERNRPLA